jgi:hypothetical protein
LWTGRRFQWRFFSDHVEFQQFATGPGKLGRCYFLSNGVSNRWDNGTTRGRAWDAVIYADRYFAPNPNLADQLESNIAMPQILGFSIGREESSELDFRPERMAGTFAPPPLFLAFHLDNTWTGVGIGTKPGDYQFPALEYSGSRYAGASFYVDYMGYRNVSDRFASPVLTINMAYSPLDALHNFTSGFRQMDWQRLLSQKMLSGTTCPSSVAGPSRRGLSFSRVTALMLCCARCGTAEPVPFIPALDGCRTPILFLRHIKLKCGSRGTNLPCGLLRQVEVGGDHPCASLRQCQCDRLPDALTGARDQGHAPFVCSY